MWFAQRFRLLTLMQLVLEDVKKYNFILAHNRSQLFAAEDDLYEYNARNFTEFDDVGTTGKDLKDEDETIIQAQQSLAQIRKGSSETYVNRLPHEKTEDLAFWRCHLRRHEPFWIGYKYQTPFGLDKDSEWGLDLLFFGTQQLRLSLLGPDKEVRDPKSLIENLFNEVPNEFTNKWAATPLGELSDLTLQAAPNTFYTNWHAFSAQYHSRLVTPIVDVFSDESFAIDTAQIFRQYWKKVYKNGLEAGDSIETLLQQQEDQKFSKDLLMEPRFENFDNLEDIEELIIEPHLVGVLGKGTGPKSLVNSTELQERNRSRVLQTTIGGPDEEDDVGEVWIEDWEDWADWVEEGPFLDPLLNPADLESLKSSGEIEEWVDFEVSGGLEGLADFGGLPSLEDYGNFGNLVDEFEGNAEAATEYVESRLRESQYDYTQLFPTYHAHYFEELLDSSDNVIDMKDQISWVEKESFKSRRLAGGLLAGCASDYEFLESFRGLYGTIQCYAFEWFWSPNLYEVEHEDDWWGYLKRIKDNPYALFNYLGEPGFIDYDWIQRICRVLLISRWLYLLRPLREHICNDIVIEEPRQLQSYSAKIPPTSKIVTKHLENELDERLLKYQIIPKIWYEETKQIILEEEAGAYYEAERNREAEEIRLKEQEEELRKLIEKISGE